MMRPSTLVERESVGSISAKYPKLRAVSRFVE